MKEECIPGDSESLLLNQVLSSMDEYFSKHLHAIHLPQSKSP